MPRGAFCPLDCVATTLMYPPGTLRVYAPCQRAKFAAWQLRMALGVGSTFWVGCLLLGFAVGSVAAAEAAVLRQLEPVGVGLFVLLRVVVAALTFLASEHDHHAILFFRHLRS